MHYKRFFVQNSMVFITIVSYNRQQILLDNIDLIKNSLRYAKAKYDFKIIAIVILKDHLHLILELNNNNDYPNIVKYFKTYFSRHIDMPNNDLTDGKKHKREKGIWQSRYWAHLILDENDLYKHIDYIHYNPMKHYNISPKDWEFSSFMKFVKNGYYNVDWCNYKDIYNITKLNFE